MTERLLIIGWDGADWDILHPLRRSGHLPNIDAMLRTGAYGTLSSTIPSHSWAAWPSFLTGRHPAGHGVFDFVERHPEDPQRRVPVTSTSIRAETFLERLSAAGHHVRAANIPVTYPPIEVKGRMIGGVAIPRGASFVHPRAFASELERRAQFPVNGMEWGRYRGDPKGLIEEAARLVEQRTASFQVLLEGTWSVAACVYLAPDRLQHPFGAYLLPSHPEYDRLAETPIAESLREIYRRLDSHLGRLAESCGPDTTTILMSDHGFRPINRTWNVNRLLQELGFATSARGAATSLVRSGTARRVARSRVGSALRRHVRSPAKLDWARTAAYESTLDGGISINLRGREPEGIIDASDYERVRRELQGALLAYRDPESGESPVARVRLKDELAPGPHIDLAPDLIAEPAPLKDFGHTRELAEWTTWPSGDHRREGILLASGGRTSGGELPERHITDIAATAVAFADVPSGPIDGTPIKEIAGRDFIRADESDETRVDRGRREDAMSEADDAYVEQHLRDLGYIE